MSHLCGATSLGSFFAFCADSLLTMIKLLLKPALLERNANEFRKKQRAPSPTAVKWPVHNYVFDDV
jgi:hypothetical protein